MNTEEQISWFPAIYNFTNRIAAATSMLPNREYHALSR